MLLEMRFEKNIVKWNKEIKKMDFVVMKKRKAL